MRVMGVAGGGARARPSEVDLEDMYVPLRFAKTSTRAVIGGRVAADI
ncbi:MAG: hypothetical protein IPI49_12220 [Myxococcales bacterium]|nr:hypothetical protein [Myxococcales bacterium]